MASMKMLLNVDAVIMANDEKAMLVLTSTVCVWGGLHSCSS